MQTNTSVSVSEKVGLAFEGEKKVVNEIRGPSAAIFADNCRLEMLTVL